jgi:glycine/D-amino acid oxidase-like deaminating enzyme
MSNQIFLNQSEHTKDIRTLSYWVDSIHHSEYSSLTEDITTDVVIVGGGIAGLSVAYGLAKEGRDCVVVENGLIGGGETRNSSAHLTNALDSRYYTLERIYGEKYTRLVAKSHTAAINRIERIVQRENIECGFERVNGYLFLHPTDTIKSLQREFEVTRRAGLSTELVTSIPNVRLKEKIGLKFPQQAQFHPLKYLHGLCAAIVGSGGKVFTNTRVVSFDREGVNTEHHRISAKHIVIATNLPPGSSFPFLNKQVTYRSYLVGVTVHKGLISPSLWWDTGWQQNPTNISPYHYARIQQMNGEYDLLICGGQDHVGTDETIPAEEPERYAQLEEWVFDHFPMSQNVVYRWSGLISEPDDLLGYIGRNPGDDNIYVVTGDAGNGLTYGAIAGNLIPDLINGHENPWEKIYSPSRSFNQTLEKKIERRTKTLTTPSKNRLGRSGKETHHRTGNF